MPPSKRLRALVLFRGLTVVGMILVNCSGSDDAYRLLEHAPWHGLTLADFVFPSFLVIMGVSAASPRTRPAARAGSSPRRTSRGTRSASGAQLGLFLLGLMVNVVLYHGTDGVCAGPASCSASPLCSFCATSFLLLDLPAARARSSPRPSCSSATGFCSRAFPSRATARACSRRRGTSRLGWTAA